MTLTHGGGRLEVPFLRRHSTLLLALLIATVGSAILVTFFVVGVGRITELRPIARRSRS